jgi:hypothetical protein
LGGLFVEGLLLEGLLLEGLLLEGEGLLLDLSSSSLSLTECIFLFRKSRSPVNPKTK